jgi:hypothetical protein
VKLTTSHNHQLLSHYFGRKPDNHLDDYSLLTLCKADVAAGTKAKKSPSLHREGLDFVIG